MGRDAGWTSATIRWTEDLKQIEPGTIMPKLGR
jgi:hypothetical protein